MAANFKFIDLFAGIGGFHHALSDPSFGGECVLACDIDKDCREVYEATWPGMSGKIFGDIRKITLNDDGSDRSPEELAKLVPDHDVLCAGFPCQPFSKSGAQKGILDSTRGTLFFDIMKIAQAKKPRFMLLENVRNLAGPRHEKTWDTIVAALREQGYRVSDTPVVFSPHLMPASDGGRPQTRERVFILATLAREGEDLFEEPLVARGPVPGWDPTRWNVEDFLIDDVDVPDISKYQLREDEQAWLDAWQAFVTGIKAESLPGFPIWVDAFTATPSIPADTPEWKADFLKKNSQFYVSNKKFIDAWLSKSWIKKKTYKVADFPPSRRKFEWQAKAAQPKRKDRDLWKLTIHLRPSGVRVKPATYLPALVAITQTSIIGSRRRRITPVEAGRLQGIPDTVFVGVEDKVAYKQAGNGVNVGAVQHVAKALFSKAGVSWGTPTGPSGA